MVLPKPAVRDDLEHLAQRLAKLEEELLAARERIAILEEENARLRGENQRLREENERLKRQLAAARKTSATSSKPPSSDIVKPPKPPRKDGKKRQRGGQPGHAQHLRTPFPPEDVNRFVPYTLDCCPECGGSLVPSRHKPEVLQQVEIKATPIVITEHQGLAYWCPHCRKFHYAPFPTALEKAGLFGPRLLALVGWLKGVCHMSFSTIRKYFRDVMGVTVSRGFLAKVVQKVSQSLKDPYEELLGLLQREAALNVDETSHPDNGKRWWTWCFRAAMFTVFKVTPSRGCDVLLEVLGTEFSGLLGCDYFSAYRKYMRLNRNVLVQFCLAHFIRDVKFLVEHPDPQNRDYGRRVLALLKKLFATIHRRHEYASEEMFRRALVRWQNALAWEVGMEAADTREAGNLANRFYLHFEEYFRFISEPGIEPTNNLAEQVQRFVAIHRRMTQGTRSERGRGWWERMCTAVATCEQQARSSFQFLFDCVTAWIGGAPAPSLAPSPANTS
jgi:transposase